MAESALSLVERLRAALDRAEEIARIYEGGNEEWRVTAGGGLADRAHMLLHEHQVEGMLGIRRLTHIAANDPAHVLRTVAAHRKVVDRHAEVPGAEHPVCTICGFLAWDDEKMYGDLYPCPDVLALASIYFPEAPDA